MRVSALFLVLPVLLASNPAAPCSTIWVNHVGFAPQTAKVCVVPGTAPADFQVIELGHQKVAFQGRLLAGGGDFGSQLVGDFSQLTNAGTFVIRTGKDQSLPFRIGPDIYDEPLQKVQQYFRTQRCGPSTTGYNAPCHLDDGWRVDNQERQDATGGWHDACDRDTWPRCQARSGIRARSWRNCAGATATSCTCRSPRA